MSNPIPEEIEFDLVEYLQDSLSMIDDESKRSEIVDKIATIKQAQADGFFLLRVTRTSHANANFEDNITPIYTMRSFAYKTTRYGDAYNWENYILCKPCGRVDSENNNIYIDTAGRHFVVIHIAGSPAKFGDAIIRKPVF